MSEIAGPQSDPTPDANAEALLRTFLRGRDLPCPSCGYNLRDLAHPRCPECGDVVELRVALTEPKIGLLVAGVVSISAGAGFSLLMVVYFVLMFMVFRQPAPRDLMHTFWLWIVCPAVVQSIALLVWLKAWKRVRRMRPAFKRVLLLVALTLPLANIVLFTANIR